MQEMFRYSRVYGLDVNSLYTRKVTDMSKMFRDINVKSLDLQNFNTANVTDMSGMFRVCNAEPFFFQRILIPQLFKICQVCLGIQE